MVVRWCRLICGLWYMLCRRRGCARRCRRRGGGTAARCWPPWAALRRGGCARRRQAWSARSTATRSSRRRPAKRAPSARRGWAWPGATRPSPRASAPRCAAVCVCEAEAEDARSCCFGEAPAAHANGASMPKLACKSCGSGGACVLLLPCRHLCLCRVCDEAGVDACPVCATTRNGSLHVLFS
jgi:E3 ubiquitin-protein ligase BOI and related proteins